jgi:hypothetical protein
MNLASSQGGEGSSAVGRLVSFARSNFMALATARQLKKNLYPTFFLPKPPNYDIIKGLSVTKVARPITQSPLSSRSQKNQI